MLDLKQVILFWYVSFSCIIISSSVDVISSELTNNNVDRSIDLSTQITKITYKFTIENTGKTPAKYFIFALEQELKPHISFLNALTPDNKQNLKIVLSKIPGHENSLLWRVDFRDTLQPSKTAIVELDLFLTHYLNPYPASISQREKQFMLYNGNHYVYSPYKTLKQTTTVILGTRNVENYSKLKPVSQSDTNIVYGPFSNIAPFSNDKMTVHYENNSPFLTVAQLERIIEVSHWGNIAVEETISLEHRGAVLKGSFSRYELQREAQSGLASVKSFKTLLPASASDAYYRDEIGNISTSHMRILSDSVELDLRPRFPLFGGWKTKYTIGYNVPSYEYLYNSGDEFVLRMRLVDHVYDDMIVEDVTTKIILPEGSRNIEIKTPYSVQRLPDSVHYTYLDSIGRKVISLRKQNLIENHIQDFDLKYNFPKILMLQEPLLAIAGFYVIFLLVILYVRLDFSISKPDPRKEE